MRYFLAVIGLLLATALPAVAQNAGPNVQARLVAENSAVSPGSTVTVALVEDIRSGWHTYWVNPGDAGAPTEIKWTLPQGWRAGGIEWPTPKRLPVGPLMDYGYEGKLWLLQTLSVPADAKVGETITLKAAADWLVCKDVCVPENATLTLPIKIGPATPDPTAAKDFALARSLMPVASPWKLTYSLGKTLDIYVTAPALAAAHPIDASFFSDKPNIVDGDAQQTLAFTKDGLVVRLPPANKTIKIAGTLTGVLVLKSADGSIQALNVSAPSNADASAIPNESRALGTGEITLLVAIFSAFSRWPHSECHAVRVAHSGDEGAGVGQAQWARKQGSGPRRLVLLGGRYPEFSGSWSGNRASATRGRFGGMGLSAARADRRSRLRAFSLRGRP